MAARVRMIDIAEKAGVSRSTVSLALSDTSLEKYQVCPKTVAKVRRIAREMDYRPNRLGVALVSSKSHTIGVLLSKLSTRASHQTEMDAISDELGNQYTIFSVFYGEQAPEREQRALMAFVDFQVDGILAMWSGAPENVNTYRDVAERYNIPLVLLERGVPGLHVPVVASDYYASTYEAVIALHRLGHRKITLMSHAESLHLPLYSEEEQKGYLAAMDALGCARHKIIYQPQQFGVDQHQEPYIAPYCEALAAHVQATGEATAIITVGDYLALSLIERCRRRRIAIPGSLSVIGTGNFDFTATELADISSVDEHHYRIGLEAARLLLERINGGEVSNQTHRVPVEVVLRGTVGPAPL